MSATTYPIRSVRAAPGALPTVGAPIEGRWYAGMHVDGGMERAGVLARYEGGGIWSTDDLPNDKDDGPDMTDYDYLQEQF